MTVEAFLPCAAGWVDEVPEMPAWLAEAPLSGEPCGCGHCDTCGQEWAEPAVPELPACLAEAPHAVTTLALPCGCAHCVPSETGFNFHHAPDSLVEVCRAEWRAAQQHTARMWQAVAGMHHAAGPAKAEFVADDLALITGLHPRSGLHLQLTAVQACAVPALAALVEAGELSSKHAEALIGEASRWADTEEQRTELIARTVERCQRSVDRGGSWPTPGELKKRMRTVALLLDLTAAEKAKKRVSERRTVELLQTGIGAAQLSICGPEVAVVQMMDAIRARAEAMGRLPGNTRDLEQRLFDAAHELLTVDADGGESVVPTLDEDALPVPLTVRGVEMAVVTPYSVLAGGDLELAEIVGLGPILPSTARELAAQAVTVRRVAVDATTGQVLAVDDAVPGPAHARYRPAQPDLMLSPDPVPATAGDDSGDDPDDDSSPDGGLPGPSDEPAPPAPPSASLPEQREPAENTLVPADCRPQPRVLVPAAVTALLRAVVSAPVRYRDLRSTRYRVSSRLRRFVEHRDRTCCFPGCTVPGRYCDVDHREPWPHGSTSTENCHCLCRRHHRAKQAYFTVYLDPDTGDTVWTTPDGREYRRPPPAF